MKKKITAETLYDFRYVSAPSISPDGKKTAFIIQYADKDENTYKGNIWLIDNKTEEISQLTYGGDAKTCFWADNNKLYFNAVRDKKVKEAIEAGEEKTLYYEISPCGGEAKLAFTIEASVADIKQISGDLFAVIAVTDKSRPDTKGMSPEEKAKALKEYKEKPYTEITEWPFWQNGGSFTGKSRNTLFLYDAKQNKLKQITKEDTDLSGFDADKKYIVYTASIHKGVRHYYDDEVYVYSVEDKKTKCILKPGAMFISGAYLLDDGVIIAATKGEKYGTEEYPDIYYYDLKADKLNLIGPFDAPFGYGTVGSDARLGGGNGAKADGGKLYFITTDDGDAYLCSIDKDGNLSKNLTPAGSCDSFDIKDGKIIYCGLYGADTPELYREGKRLTHFSISEEYEVSTPEEFTFTNADGYEIKGWAMKPTVFKSDKKYPAILHIHGGPRTVFGGVFHHEMQLWANAGYFVIYCNPRGSDGKGSEFGYISGKYGSIDYEDIMAFKDEALKKYPQIDAENLGVGGGSYGGYMTNWIIGHTDCFKAAVSQRSIANWVTFEHTTDIGVDFAKTQMNTSTREDEQKMWDFSPLKYAYNCVTPTLFIHSDSDYRCWMSEGLSMFTALKVSGCDTKLCLFKGENHELSRSGKPLARISRMTEILNWYDKYLKK